MKKRKLRSGVNSEGALKQKGVKQTSLNKGTVTTTYTTCYSITRFRIFPVKYIYVFRMNLQINSGYVYTVFFWVSTSCGNYLFRCLRGTYCLRLRSDWICFRWILKWVGRNVWWLYGSVWKSLVNLNFGWGRRFGLVLGHKESVSKRWRQYASLKRRNIYLPHSLGNQKKTTNLWNRR
jgi:hypothetical protein